MEECRIRHCDTTRKVFFNPKIPPTLPRKLPNFGTFSDSKFPKDFSSFSVIWSIILLFTYVSDGRIRTSTLKCMWEHFRRTESRTFSSSIVGACTPVAVCVKQTVVAIYTVITYKDYNWDISLSNRVVWLTPYQLYIEDSFFLQQSFIWYYTIYLTTCFTDVRPNTFYHNGLIINFQNTAVCIDLYNTNVSQTTSIVSTNMVSKTHFQIGFQ